MSDNGYVRRKREQLQAHDLEVWAVSQHMVGQAVSDPIDERYREVLPARVWGDGTPDGVMHRAAEEVKRTAAAADALGVDVVTGFTGSPVWHLLYAFPPTPQDMIDDGYRTFADQWTPILDAFAEEGVQFALGGASHRNCV